MINRPCLVVLLCAAAVGTGRSQSDPVPAGIFVPATAGTGNVTNGSAAVVSAPPIFVSHPGAAWMRVWFDEPTLPAGCAIRIHGLRDDVSQVLDSQTLDRWAHASAFFNGDTVSVELLVAPFATASVNLSGYDAGFPAPAAIDSICGPTDDRVPSTEPRVGRLLVGGGGGTAICSGGLVSISSCFATAGHCVSGGAQVTVEFNCPPSNANGSVVHPSPQDQYPMDMSSLSFADAGVGDDWAVGRLFANTTTGLSAAQVQGFYPLSTTGPQLASAVRVTGFGTATGALNQTNQTHLATVTSLNGAGPNSILHAVDTTGGSSGALVIHEATQSVVGVHTHGGCTSTGGANAGTSILHPGFSAQIRALCLYAITVTQAGPGQSVTVAVTNAPPGSELFNVVSFLPAVPTGTGPLFGLAVGPGAGDILGQISLPLGTAPLHVLADAGGNYSLTFPTTGTGPTLTFDVVSLAFTAGAGFGAFLANSPATTATIGL